MLDKVWILTCSACERDYAEGTGQSLVEVNREGHQTRRGIEALARQDGWTVGREHQFCPSCR